MNTFDSNFFLTNDGTRLEVFCSVPEKAKACLVVWPCMGGVVQMYKAPVDALMAQGCACVLYNPRGHGTSGKSLEIQASLNDLEEILQRCIPDGLPLVMLGHSAGANACLQYAAKYRCPEQLVLVAPVLDSRESLFSMYRGGTINEFIDVLCTYTKDETLIRQVLANDEWLVVEEWKAKGFRQLLDAVPSRVNIGQFLEKLFIPGHNVFSELGRFSDRTRILMAMQDTWYPAETVKKLARKHGIPIETMPEAKHHFFQGAWERVWTQMLDTIRPIVGNL